MTKLRIAIATVAVLAVAGGVAYADQTIYAVPENMFVGSGVTIAQGEKVTFTNGDIATHDVTAKALGANGKPLFQSEKTGPGQSNEVVGADKLPAGTYDYNCSIHPNMTGTITVTGSGTPAGGGDSGGGSSSSNSSSDTTPATVSVKVLDTKRAKVRKRHSLQISVTTNEAATFTFKAVSGSTTVATGKAKLTKAGTKKVSLKITKAGAKLIKKKKTVPVTVTADAKDGAGNASSASASGKLR